MSLPICPWDHTLKIGDIVTCCYAGYYELTEIEQRKYHGKPTNPLAHLRQVAHADGRAIQAPNVKKSCDMTFCTRVDWASINNALDKEIDAAKTKAENLFAILAKHITAT